MKITLADVMRAVDDLEILGRKIFDDIAPLWDEDERSFKRALAILRAMVDERNKT